MNRAWMDVLEESYRTWAEMELEPISRSAFVAEHIMDMAIYDDELAESMAKRMLGVCLAITNGTTFDYIKDPSDYEWYIALCNTEFLGPKITWGGSIRGAFWECEIALNTVALWHLGHQITSPVIFDREEWESFIHALVEFTAKEAAHD